ncbi:MAG: carbonic anhydrase [Aeromicrobium sp.]|uniref:beta-class carbonic anhydrase n=1 Tax=Aeromicrobium sp. TaxID=1871063 RepID=UPI0039E6AB26
MSFDDLLDANRSYAVDFAHGGFDGIARSGVAMVTCMDSRIDPLAMIGLRPGDAKILRNPGGRVTDQVLVAVVLGVTLLQVERLMVVQHTRCAMASSTEKEIQARIAEKTGQDASWMSLGVIDDQETTIRADVHKARSHPLVPDSVEIGGFLYDVDTGLLHQLA